MQDLELWTLDELCDHAFDIFEELAADNLTAIDYSMYQQNADSRGFVDLVPATEDWVEIMMQDIEPELQLEAQIGLTGIDGEVDIVFARILLSREKHESLCHAQWRGQ